MQRFNCKKIYCETIQLFNSTLNKLAVNDQYVSSMTVVLHPEMNDQSRHVQMNKTARNQKNLRKLHRQENSVASLEHAHINLAIIYVTTHEQKAPINMLSHNKTPKIQQVAKVFVLVKSIILGKKQKKLKT